MNHVTPLLILAIAACSSREEPTGKPATPVVMASANPAGMAPQQNTAVPGSSGTLDRYQRLLRNVEDCPLEGYQVVPTCPGAHTFDTQMRSVEPAVMASLGRDMIGSASPAVRVKAAELMARGGADADLDAIAGAATRELDAGVLRAFIRAIADHGARPQVVAVLLAAATHADRDVRVQAVYALTSPANRGLAGAAAKLAAVAERDPDQKVRQTACEHAGKLGTDELLPLYEKLTAPGTDPELTAACFEGLVRMFHDHPAFANANERAYKLFLRRLDAKPRTEHSPPWTVMSTFCYFSHESDLDKLAAWKRQATWFEPAAVKRALASVIADKRASWMARAAAVESMVGLGATKAELDALRRGYSPRDAGDKPVLDKIAGALSQ